MSLRFACDRCGQLEEPRWLHGGLCSDCAFGWEDQPATCGADGPVPDVTNCVACGRMHVRTGELCGLCNRDVAAEMDDLFVDGRPRGFAR